MFGEHDLTRPSPAPLNDAVRVCLVTEGRRTTVKKKDVWEQTGGGVHWGGANVVVTTQTWKGGLL